MRRLFSMVVVTVLAGAWALAQAPVEITVWWHTGKPEELEVISSQVEEFNAAQDRIRVKLVNIPEAEYTAQVRAAGLAGKLPDLLDLDGPTLANFVWNGWMIPLDEYVSDELREDLLPSIIAQGTYPPDGKLYAIGVFDSGLAIWGNREYLVRAGVRIPTSVDDAWSLNEFEEALGKLAALPEVEWPLDLKLNYGAGEWFTYGFSPIIQAFGGDLINRTTWEAQGTLDGIASVLGMTLFQHWVERGWVVPASAGDDAFYGKKKAALAWVGHWMYEPHTQGLGEDLVLIPMPKLGAGCRAVTGMGSWAWGITSTSRHPEAAWEFLEYLLRPDQILRMTAANGAVPSRRSAIAQSELYGPGGMLSVFAEQLTTIAVPRPVHPAYPVITAAFAEAVKNIVAGADVYEELHKAALKIDQDIEDNEGYPPFGG
ncbi:MAG: Extracellular solute-binding protein family 1 [Acetothermia bacterium 64_32]|nr:MAG: Extracellular solute-binding protein family 1 [Acetothermia bacterium 64_32]HAF70763.1 ABC transporter substrate-binding protein [Candidatus Acetothermia bacterium]